MRRFCFQQQQRNARLPTTKLLSLRTQKHLTGSSYGAKGRLKGNVINVVIDSLNSLTTTSVFTLKLWHEQLGKRLRINKQNISSSVEALNVNAKRIMYDSQCFWIKLFLKQNQSITKHKSIEQIVSNVQRCKKDSNLPPKCSVLILQYSVQY